ncbi:hypothetical protein DFJ74DRAFT_687954 [Hyaloraphidium curvatum]|nr:hypothetical protein DFJ74DRAFT_687954 [Hyaloraphidium curvatum]
MAGMAHCMNMAKAFHLPYAAEPGFGVLNHERAAQLASAGVDGNRAQLWVLTTGFEDVDTYGDFAFTGDAAAYDNVESFPAEAAKHGDADLVCGGDSSPMADVPVEKRRIHHYDGTTTPSRFAELFPREAQLFSTKDFADKLFMAEVVGMHECVAKAITGEAGSGKIVIGLRGLEDILMVHGSESSQYAAAKRILEDSVAKLHGTFAQKFTDSVSGFVTVPAHLTTVKRHMKSHLHRRSIPSAEWNSNGLSTNPRIAALQICAPDAASCEAVTLGCTGHGVCVKTAIIVANATLIPTAERDKVAEAKFCYVCDCNQVLANGTGPTWTGWYQEISGQFNLLFWSTVMMLTILIITLHFVFKGADDGKQD